MCISLLTDDVLKHSLLIENLRYDKGKEGMVRPTDGEMIAMEKIICCSQFLRGGFTSHLRGPGKAQGSDGQENTWPRVFIVVSTKEQARQAKQR